jgi:hypothetical protein
VRRMLADAGGHVVFSRPNNCGRGVGCVAGPLANAASAWLLTLRDLVSQVDSNLNSPLVEWIVELAHPELLAEINL